MTLPIFCEPRRAVTGPRLQRQPEPHCDYCAEIHDLRDDNSPAAFAVACAGILAGVGLGMAACWMWGVWWLIQR